MKWSFPKFDMRSLLLVLAAFIGNAQIMGFDLVLLILVTVFVLQLREPLTIQRARVIPLFFYFSLLIGSSLRSLDASVSYFADYWLWPIKALMLMLLVAFGRDLKWPMGNMAALALISAALVTVGEIENGRLVSVFGPNMLYRIFGFLLFFSVMLYLEDQSNNRPLLALFAIFGLFSALLTGSSGALLVIAAVVIVALLRISKVFSTLLVSICVYWILTSGLFVGSLTVAENAPSFYSRLAYKLTEIEANARFVNWSYFLTSPFHLIGYNHADFGNIWTFGFEYPHNLFVELYIFYGLLGVFLILSVVFACARFLPLALQGNIYAMTFYVILIGSMASGDLSDNYAVVGLLGALFIKREQTNLKRNRLNEHMSSNYGHGITQ